MPTVSEFFGITIKIMYLDHNPPHFHAYYGEQKAIIEIENGRVKGYMSERAIRLIFEWMEMHREELKEAWRKAKNGEKPSKIEPLR